MLARKGWSRLSLARLRPPAQGLLIFVGEDVLEHIAQADSAPEFGVAIAQGASLLALLLTAGPFIAAQSPERSLQIGSRPGQFLADPLDSLASHLHEMKRSKTIWTCGKNWLAPL